MSSLKAHISEFHVRAGEAEVPVKNLTDTGLDLDIKDAPLLRGFVLLCAGDDVVTEAYIDCVDETRGALHYVFGGPTPPLVSGV